MIVIAFPGGFYRAIDRYDWRSAVRLFQWDDDQVCIFDNEDFGYRRITIERPLRLNFEADKARIARIKGITAFANLAAGKKRRDTKAAQVWAEVPGNNHFRIAQSCVQSVVKNRDEFAEMIKDAFQTANVKVQAALFKAILMALAERDETGGICADSKGTPALDPGLHEYDNVPLKEDVNDYMKSEVLPHVLDAWLDKFKTKIGCEINFSRYFYKYRPPRLLDKIEQEIADILAEVT